MSNFTKFADKAEADLQVAAAPILEALEKELITYFQHTLNRVPHIDSLGTVNGELCVTGVDGKIVYFDKWGFYVNLANVAVSEYTAATGYVPQPMQIFRDKVDYKH